MTWQNHDPKPRGSFVVNVHPCATYDDAGVVEGGPCGLDLISVRIGTGSTVYGPAENWAPTDRRPEWLTRAEAAAA